jgi:hypothetical protein
MIFSQEMDNAIKLGYKFEILWGYTFKGENIFSNIINDLYTMRKSYPKSDPMNYIAKILMNSLYGRFGMDDNFNEWIIIDKDLLRDFLDNMTEENEILDIIDLDNKLLIQYKDLTNRPQSNDHNINIAIASAITSYSRIHMSQFKNNSNYKLFYSDTDSIYINKPLSKELINSSEIGKLKLEFIADKAIFLASKVYALENYKDYISKIKGLHSKKYFKITEKDIEIINDSFSFNDFEKLLYKDSFLINHHEKWYKSLEDSSITIKNQVYTLKVTSNKRELIYNNDNKLVNTRPYKINKDEILVGPIL